jgi:hypothetical protein
LPLHVYVSDKRQTEPSAETQLGSPRDARHYLK